MNMSGFCTIAAITVFLSISTVATAEIYKWTDRYGKMHFTDRPPVNQQVEEIEIKVNTYSAVEVKPLVERLGRKDKVVMYTATWCGICKKAKAYFHRKGIAYVAYDVDKSSIGKRDYKLLNGSSVPIILIGDKRVNGFTETRFEKIYQQQMKQRAADKLADEGV